MSEYPFQVNERIHIIASPENTGTVTSVGVSGFQVSWDGHDRKHREPRSRFTYEWSVAHNFKSGNPKPVQKQQEETRETING